MNNSKPITPFTKKHEKCLSSFFEYFDRQICDFFEFNLQTHDEEKIVGAFIFYFKFCTSSQHYRNLIKCLNTKTNPLSIKISTYENSRINENKTGWDLVILLDIKIKKFKTVKFGLFQAKRLFLDNNDFTFNSKYNSLNKRTKNQALKMQNQTKSSYYIFFSPSLILDKTIGIRIATTETIQSLTDLPPTLETIYPISIGFSDFMIKFLRCEQGDTSLKNIKKLFDTKKRRLYWNICIRDKDNIEEPFFLDNEEISFLSFCK